MTDVLSPARAYDLQVQVVAACSAVKQSWVLLAGRLHAFHTERAWEALGVESFTTWLGGPEVGLKRSQAYLLIDAWQHVVVDGGADPARLAAADVSKVAVVLPALKRGEVTVDDALADCEALSRSDLSDRYRGDPSARLDAETEPGWHQCSCGNRHKEGATP
ncbi:MAG TPA: hypothetical protein VK631_25110 [Solirubrobacteraceae bacterium]|nr:hypothetical protein [Solirubrobacteraceae bacterium]